MAKSTCIFLMNPVSHFVGCVGGANTALYLTPARTAPAAGTTSMTLEVKGLRGVTLSKYSARMCFTTPSFPTLAVARAVATFRQARRILQHGRLRCRCAICRTVGAIMARMRPRGDYSARRARRGALSAEPISVSHVIPAWEQMRNAKTETPVGPLSRYQWVDLRNGVDNPVAMDRLAAAARG